MGGVDGRAVEGAAVSRIRVLVVDDSVVVRRIMTDVLSSEADLEVVGTAANGRIALTKITQLSPDLVTLDVEMPEMDGLDTLRELRRHHPRLPVVMFSTVTERGASVTVEALLRGADDYVAKPANVGSVSEAMQRIREQLVPKVRLLCRRGSGAEPVGVRRPPVGLAVAARRRAAPLAAIALGVSTGGPSALAALLPQLPADLGVPLLIVQHMPPTFTRLLAERLGARSALRVAEGTDGTAVVPNQVWIAPGDRHLAVRRAGGQVRLATTSGPPEHSCRPAVDVLFRSAAEVYGAGLLAVVLTGMGQDGRRGCEQVRAAGGQVLVQDEASSVVWGMPGAVARAGLADAVLPLSGLATEITRRVGAVRLTTLTP